jgi:hypothetical protein
MEPVGFWQFVRMCIQSAEDATLSFLGWDTKTLLLGAASLVIGYFLFWWKRGRKDTQQRAREDFLLIVAPLALLGLSLFIFNLARSPFLVYRNTEHSLQQRVQKLEQDNQICAKALAEEKDKSQPKLTLNIDQLAVGEWHAGALPRETGVLVFASLTNDGAPSIAEGWRLEVALPDGRSVKLPSVYMSPHTTSSGRGWKMDNDPLYEKAMTPIERGAKPRGTLLFLTTAFTYKEMKEVGTKYILNCIDIHGKGVQGELTWTEQMSTMPQYYPGLHIEH